MLNIFPIPVKTQEPIKVYQATESRQKVTYLNKRLTNLQNISPEGGFIWEILGGFFNHVIGDSSILVLNEKSTNTATTVIAYIDNGADVNGSIPLMTIITGAGVPVGNEHVISPNLPLVVGEQYFINFASLGAGAYCNLYIKETQIT